MNYNNKRIGMAISWGILFILAIGYIWYCNSEGNSQAEKFQLMKKAQLFQLIELDK